MPHDALTIREDVVSKISHGGHDQVVRTQHIAPADGDGNVAHDPHARMDLANAKWMMEILQRHYPGYLWRCVHDGAQGMAYLSIPILMGINKYWAINLKTDPLNEGLVMRAGGSLLERYGLSRQRFNIGQFLEAREKHSALVLASRKVPE